MLGRGLVSDPGLALALRGQTTPHWEDLAPSLGLYSRLIAPRVAARHRGGRIKQWLNMLRKRFAGAQVAYDNVRHLNDADAIDRCLQALLHADIQPAIHPAIHTALPQPQLAAA